MVRYIALQGVVADAYGAMAQRSLQDKTEGSRRKNWDPVAHHESPGTEPEVPRQEAEA
jgi:hypothetical protein